MKASTTKFLLAASIAAVGTMGLSGCVVAPRHHQPYYLGGSMVVPVGPPPNRVEVVGVTPFVGAVWIPGHWIWRDRWVWNKGYWTRPPRHGARWERGRWEKRHQREWRWHPGRWQ